MSDLNVDLSLIHSLKKIYLKNVFLTSYWHSNINEIIRHVHITSDICQHKDLTRQHDYPTCQHKDLTRRHDYPTCQYTDLKRRHDYLTSQYKHLTR